MGMVDDGDVIPALRQVDHSTSFVGYGTTSVIACNKFAIYESGRHRFVAYAMSFRFVKYGPSFHTVYNYSFCWALFTVCGIVILRKIWSFFYSREESGWKPETFHFSNRYYFDIILGFHLSGSQYVLYQTVDLWDARRKTGKS